MNAHFIQWIYGTNATPLRPTTRRATGNLERGETVQPFCGVHAQMPVARLCSEQPISEIIN